MANDICIKCKKVDGNDIKCCYDPGQKVFPLKCGLLKTQIIDPSEAKHIASSFKGKSADYVCDDFGRVVGHELGWTGASPENPFDASSPKRRK